MSVQSEINRIKLNISNALDAVAAYGVQIEETDGSDELATRIVLIADALEGFVKYTLQTLTDTLKLQARKNIGAISSNDIPTIPTNISAFNNDVGYLILQDISGKLDKIDDLDAIRKGASLGATALLSYTESDPTVPLYIKEASTEELLEQSLSRYRALDVSSLECDLNTLTHKQSYSINVSGNEMSNFPDYYQNERKWFGGMLLVHKAGHGGGGNPICQILIAYSGELYQRCFWGDSWSLWKRSDNFSCSTLDELATALKAIW